MVPRVTLAITNDKNIMMWRLLRFALGIVYRAMINPQANINQLKQILKPRTGTAA